jgi:small-conductance mechanosensitive channel
MSLPGVLRQTEGHSEFHGLEVNLIFQEPEQPLSTRGVLDRLYDYLTYPLIPNANYRISILSILLFAFVIFVALFISRVIRKFLDKRVLPNFSHIDTGFKYTLLRVLHYLIIFLGLLYALKIGFGADLTGLAVIIGFLSVGIGFGLQAITGDVISGFILLFERPLRVGDYLKLGEMEGRVSQINLRSTMIVTNDQVTIIVPNSELVKNHVINWSYSSKVRIKIPVETDDKNHLQTINETLIQAAQGIDHVLSDPKPKVRFLGYGDTSLKFELLIWTDAPHDHQQIRSDVNSQIHQLFHETGIATPIPQRDFKIQGGVIQFDKKKKAKGRAPSQNDESSSGQAHEAPEQSKTRVKILPED